MTELLAFINKLYILAKTAILTVLTISGFVAVALLVSFVGAILVPISFMCIVAVIIYLEISPPAKEPPQPPL